MSEDQVPITEGPCPRATQITPGFFRTATRPPQCLRPAPSAEPRRWRSRTGAGAAVRISGAMLSASSRVMAQATGPPIAARSASPFRSRHPAVHWILLEQRKLPGPGSTAAISR